MHGTMNVKRLCVHKIQPLVYSYFYLESNADIHISYINVFKINFISI